MITNSSISRTPARPWPSDAHDLRGLLALACPSLPGMLPNKGHEQQADKPQREREDDFHGKEDLFSKALAGSGDM